MGTTPRRSYCYVSTTDTASARYDINFGYTNLTENYEHNSGVLNPSTGVTNGGFSRGSIPANVYEISSAYVVKRPQNGSRFQPFAEAGGGVLIFAPTRRHLKAIRVIGHHFFSEEALITGSMQIGGCAQSIEVCFIRTRTLRQSIASFPSASPLR